MFSQKVILFPHNGNLDTSNIDSSVGVVAEM